MWKKGGGVKKNFVTLLAENIDCKISKKALIQNYIKSLFCSEQPKNASTKTDLICHLIIWRAFHLLLQCLYSIWRIKILSVGLLRYVYTVDKVLNYSRFNKKLSFKLQITSLFLFYDPTSEEIFSKRNQI